MSITIIQKTRETRIALSFSILGALSDMLQKYLATKILLDEEHVGSDLANYPHTLYGLRAFAIFCAAISMLESITLETSNANLLIHKLFALKINFCELYSFVGRSLCSLHSWRAWRSFLISSFILTINASACMYAALSIIDDLDDYDDYYDHVAWRIFLTGAKAFLVVINTPLVFATDGGFFERFVRRCLNGLVACMKRFNTWRTYSRDSLYPGFYLYCTQVLPERVGLLINDSVADTSFTELKPVGERIWWNLTDMSECFGEELLYIPKTRCSIAMSAWLFMQVIVGGLNALIEAGFVWLVFDELSLSHYSFWLWCTMISVFLQNLALDGAVTASSLAVVIDHVSEKKENSWTTFWMKVLLFLTCTTQAFALGFLGTEQLAEKFLGDSAALWLCVLGGLLKAIPNVGVELKIFCDKFGPMFPPPVVGKRPIDEIGLTSRTSLQPML